VEDGKNRSMVIITVVRINGYLRNK
jgi:hypothetical protein